MTVAVAYGRAVLRRGAEDLREMLYIHMIRRLRGTGTGTGWSGGCRCQVGLDCDIVVVKDIQLHLAIRPTALRGGVPREWKGIALWGTRRGNGIPVPRLRKPYDIHKGHRMDVVRTNHRPKRPEGAHHCHNVRNVFEHLP